MMLSVAFKVQERREMMIQIIFPCWGENYQIILVMEGISPCLLSGKNLLTLSVNTPGPASSHQHSKKGNDIWISIMKNVLLLEMHPRK